MTRPEHDLNVEDALPLLGSIANVEVVPMKVIGDVDLLPEA